MRPPSAPSVRPGRGPGWRRSAAVGALLAGLCSGGVALAGPALAHAELASATPADSARLATAPESVTLRFSESVSLDLGYLRVVDHTGGRVDTGRPEHPGGDPSAVSVDLRPGLGDGSYVVSWRMVSADSHPVAGAYGFVVGDGPLASVGEGFPTGAAVDGTVSALFALTRWAGFVGLALLVGGAAFLVLVWPGGRGQPRVRRLVWAGWCLAAATSVLSLPLESLYGSGQGLSRVLDVSLLDPTLRGTYGRMLSVRLVALAVLALLIGHVVHAPPDPDGDAGDGERSWQVDTGAIVALGAFVTYAASGHAATGIQPPLAVLSDTLHLAAMAVWIGGLAVLAGCLLPRGGSAELVRVVPAFSRLAMAAVGTLVVTGAYQTWREVGTLPALWSTGYGRLLLAKIAGFAALVALGYVSHTGVRRRYVVPVVRALAAAPGAATLTAEPPADRDGAAEDAVRSRLRRSVGLEAVIAAVVLAVTAVLVTQAPARQTYSTSFDQTLRLSGGGSAQVEIAPARRGPNEFHLFVFGPDGRPIDPRGVRATAALPQRQLGPLSVPLRHVGVGHYVGSGLSLPDAGGWQIQVSVRTSEFDESTATAEVVVR